MPKPTSADHVNPEERRLASTAGAPSQADIAALAYELWISRGCGDGAAEEDWFEAERRLGVGETTRSDV
jgi:Protein of unknown function (DUF2934)